MNVDVYFSRELLRSTLADVRAAFPNLEPPVKAAWVYSLGRDHWEFHYGAYYWHGSASNAYEARAKGWAAFIEWRERGSPHT